jgi:antitoxin component of RelBE/YafQ-DinJ toxin-antitoxin module
MPRGTTLRNFRADDSLWKRAQAVAAKRGESLSDVLRAALERYVQRYE